MKSITRIQSFFTSCYWHTPMKWRHTTVHVYHFLVTWNDSHVFNRFTSIHFKSYSWHINKSINRCEMRYLTMHHVKYEWVMSCMWGGGGQVTHITTSCHTCGGDMSSRHSNGFVKLDMPRMRLVHVIMCDKVNVFWPTRPLKKCATRTYIQMGQWDSLIFVDPTL